MFNLPRYKEIVKQIEFCNLVRATNPREEWKLLYLYIISNEWMTITPSLQKSLSLSDLDFSNGSKLVVNEEERQGGERRGHRLAEDGYIDLFLTHFVISYSGLYLALHLLFERAPTAFSHEWSPKRLLPWLGCGSNWPTVGTWVYIIS